MATTVIRGQVTSVSAGGLTAGSTTTNANTSEDATSKSYHVLTGSVVTVAGSTNTTAGTLSNAANVVID